MLPVDASGIMRFDRRQQKNERADQSECAHPIFALFQISDRAQYDLSLARVGTPPVLISPRRRDSPCPAL
ncbi:hypothetical protein G4G27_13700 [Sphingomonas sp. So64.6b]|uniref:hypothetical protein n=1 Tax=Sphingomonas sp. So64.6b TaxID=2997354 RepID=UPI0015FFB254|nr:hypothetical protein [Sphingomonas sp. So64.6b]QNA84932.1 hypothetical protein G4G27_13700 [Sphingomonas sp. So64.6b]